MPLSCALKVFIGIYFEAQTPKLKLLSTQMVVIRPVLSIIVLSGDKKNTLEHSDTPCSVAECCCACSKVKERAEFHTYSHYRTITHRRFTNHFVQLYHYTFIPLYTLCADSMENVNQPWDYT